MTDLDPPNDQTRHILEEAHARRSMGTVLDVEEETVKLVVFVTAGVYFALHGNQIREILPYVRPAYVPGCSDMVMGIINVRGNIESVIRLERLFGLENRDITASARIMIAESGNIRSGILADSVEDVLDVTSSGVQKTIDPVNETLRGYACGQFMYHDRCVAILDLDKLFSGISYES